MIKILLKSLVLIFMAFIFNSCASQFNGLNPEVVNRFDLKADSLILVVKVKDTRFTEYYPANVTKLCSENKDCFPWAYWYVHEGKVLDVIKGDYSKNTIKFAMLQHADYIKEIKREWYVELKEFESQETIEKLSTKYFVEHQSSEYSINH